MRTSPTIATISAALLKAQTNMGSAKKGASNPFFKSKYADLNAVLEACKDALNDAKITILQPHITIDGVDYVETVLLHESGEFLMSETKIEVAKKNDPQALGSAISYARRYGLQSFISLPAEDDDAEAGVGRGKSTKPDLLSTEGKTTTGGSFKKTTTPVATNESTAKTDDGWQ